MAQDLIEQIQELCDRLREQLMKRPEYRALVSLEKTIEDLSVYMGMPDRAEVRAFTRPFAPELPEEPDAEQPFLDVNALDPSTLMTSNPDQLADALVDALRAPKISSALDHLPSHRVA